MNGFSIWKTQNLESRANKIARWIRSLTLNPLPLGEGKKREARAAIQSFPFGRGERTTTLSFLLVGRVRRRGLPGLHLLRPCRWG
jgi:hypothetical protein